MDSASQSVVAVLSTLQDRREPLAPLWSEPRRFQALLEGPDPDVARFFRAIQQTREQLLPLVAHHEQRGTRARAFIAPLGGRPYKVINSEGTRVFSGTLALGLTVMGLHGREFEFYVDTLWDEQRWTLMTEAWVEAETEGMDLLRELPERTAEELSSLLEHLRAAVNDLATFSDLVTGPPAPG